MPELFPLERCERRKETFKFRGHLAMEGRCCPPTGLGQRHVQCPPITVHGRSLSEAAPLHPVHQAGERRLLHTEALCQFGHSPGVLGDDA